MKALSIEKQRAAWTRQGLTTVAAQQAARKEDVKQASAWFAKEISNLAPEDYAGRARLRVELQDRVGMESWPLGW